MLEITTQMSPQAFLVLALYKILTMSSPNVCWEKIQCVRGEGTGLLSNNLAGIYQRYPFLCLEKNLFSLLTRVLSFDLGREPEGKDTRVAEFGALSGCV